VAPVILARALYGRYAVILLSTCWSRGVGQFHCVGPFQGQDYGVANAALAAGAHYLDLADGRQFIVEFAARINDRAARAGRAAISGASTLPALSSAVVEELRVGLSSVESIEVIIAPGQRAPLEEVAA
jgi:saccharopine dehydrogenase-like NADP-dependent oxidoreductase